MKFSRKYFFENFQRNFCFLEFFSKNSMKLLDLEKIFAFRNLGLAVFWKIFMKFFFRKLENILVFLEILKIWFFLKNSKKFLVLEDLFLFRKCSIFGFWKIGEFFSKNSKKFLLFFPKIYKKPQWFSQKVKEFFVFGKILRIFFLIQRNFLWKFL